MEAQEMLGLKKWAVIGASNKKHGFGYKIYRALKQAGYIVYPITPNYEEIDGDKAYKSILELPEVVDVAEFIINPEIGNKVIQECAKAGVKNVWLQPGSRSTEIVDFALSKEMNVVQSCVLVELRNK